MQQCRCCPTAPALTAGCAAAGRTAAPEVQAQVATAVDPEAAEAEADLVGVVVAVGVVVSFNPIGE